MDREANGNTTGLGQLALYVVHDPAHIHPFFTESAAQIPAFDERWRVRSGLPVRQRSATFAERKRKSEYAQECSRVVKILGPRQPEKIYGLFPIEIDVEFRLSPALPGQSHMKIRAGPWLRRDHNSQDGVCRPVEPGDCPLRRYALGSNSGRGWSAGGRPFHAAMAPRGSVPYPLALPNLLTFPSRSNVLILAIVAVLIVLRTIERGRISLSGTIHRLRHTKTVGCVMIRPWQNCEKAK